MRSARVLQWAQWCKAQGSQQPCAEEAEVLLPAPGLGPKCRGARRWTAAAAMGALLALAGFAAALTQQRVRPGRGRLGAPGGLIGAAAARGHHIVAFNVDMCLGRVGDEKGSFVKSVPCDESNELQQWMFDRPMSTVKSPQGKCLDNGGLAVHTWDCFGGAIGLNQQWVYDEHMRQIKSSKGLCLEASPIANTKVKLVDCSDANLNQKWNLQLAAVSEAPAPVTTHAPTMPPTTHAPTTHPPTTQPPTTQPPTTQPPTTQPPTTQPPTTQPPTTQPPTTLPPTTQPPTTQPPTTHALTQVPTQAPIQALVQPTMVPTQPPTQAPTQPPTQAPTQPPTTQPPQLIHFEAESQLAQAGLCLDAGGEAAHLTSCDVASKDQRWVVRKSNRQIRNSDGKCLDAASQTMLEVCDEGSATQQWAPDPLRGHLVTAEGQECLQPKTADATGGPVVLQDCDPSSSLQLWMSKADVAPSSGMAFGDTVIVVFIPVLLIALLIVVLFRPNLLQNEVPRREVAGLPPPPISEPHPNAVKFPDPRPNTYKPLDVSVIAFGEELSDELCGAPWLGSGFDLGPGGMVLEASGSKSSFRNAEAAFHALRFWSDADSFSGLSAAEAAQKTEELSEKEDQKFAGLGNKWAGMQAVLTAKFKSGSKLDQALDRTGDAFLLHHTTETGEQVWSDGGDGEGANWLGLQLMLLRDRRSGWRRWTPFMEDAVDTTGDEPQQGSAAKAWQDAVRSARSSLEPELQKLRQERERRQQEEAKLQNEAQTQQDAKQAQQRREAEENPQGARPLDVATDPVLLMTAAAAGAEAGSEAANGHTDEGNDEATDG